ncbi:Endocuticle structural glycoprotein SgAbd-1 [Amphibalanus amphitrite]|uniref:Endocuticle structural glycoprotein SgAbd-1 n=1 Tax=Amphibalanus amphitrite TaxID=1232801 RepID=A0A6A4WBK6_AMPAM|nr:larval cuticle protein 65Ag1-like [Amphibalanus amphitrite]XP_043225578.1 larval cuticle protein 65Ag1-like [Amphibalanus amphitrite]KAF0301040.1 Endocuticle structural glycoprotein SgAbd-1 [Amphibalanus amphitrite]
MKYLVLAALLAVAAGRPQELKTPEDYGLLRSSSVTNEDGSFQYGYETSDPSSQDVAGQVKQFDEEKVGTVQQGSYTFTAQDENGNDVQVRVDWVADENGFQAQSDALPQAPADPNAEAQAAALAKFSQIEAEKNQ